MSEEIEAQEGTEQAPIELSPVEQEAAAQGWVPKEQWTGDGKWRPAEEFLDRGELFKKIDQVSRTAKRAEQTLEEFKKHYIKVREDAYQDALAAIKAERKVARENGDFDRVDELEERLEAVKQQAATVKDEIKVAEPVEVAPEVVQWVERNKWYNEDSNMRAVADSVAMRLNKEGFSGTALLKGIDEEIKKVFPHKFTNPNRERPGAVEAGGRKTGQSKDIPDGMSDQDRRFMNDFVAKGIMSKEDYIKDWKKINKIAS